VIADSSPPPPFFWLYLRFHSGFKSPLGGIRPSERKHNQNVGVGGGRVSSMGRGSISVTAAAVVSHHHAAVLLLLLLFKRLLHLPPLQASVPA